MNQPEQTQTINDENYGDVYDLALDSTPPCAPDLRDPPQQRIHREEIGIWRMNYK